MKTVRHANAGKNFLILAAADHVSAQILSMPLSTSFPRPVRTSARVQSATCPLSAKTDLTAKAPEHIAYAFPKKGMKKKAHMSPFSGSGGGIRTYDLSGMNRSL